MKKIEYVAPELEVVLLKMENSLLLSSDGEGSTPGSGDPISTDDPIEG